MKSIEKSALPGVFEGTRGVALAAVLVWVLAGGWLAAEADARPGGGAAAGGAVVNINTASAEELQVLPGVGSSRAAAILEIRKTRGRFESVDELMDVKGIGPALLERMRPHVTLTGRTTGGASAPAAAGGGKASGRSD